MTAMPKSARIALKIAAGLLDYPGRPEFWARLADREPLACAVSPELAAVMQSFRQRGCLELAQLYVAAFDFDPKASLYITAHELGDSRDRGAALINLANRYRRAGYEVPGQQLADFLPMLLELAAVAPDAVEPPMLERLAQACGRIGEHLGPEHAYQPLLAIVWGLLGGAAAPPDSQAGAMPDLVGLPYPTDYP